MIHFQFRFLKIEYFLKWKGYDNSQNTWEPKENLECDELIKEFEDRRKREEDVRIKKILTLAPLDSILGTLIPFQAKKAAPVKEKEKKKRRLSNSSEGEGSTTSSKKKSDEKKVEPVKEKEKPRKSESERDEKSSKEKGKKIKESNSKRESNHNEKHTDDENDKSAKEPKAKKEKREDTEDKDKASPFETGLEPDKIIGATDVNGELAFLVQWKNSNKAMLIPSKLARQKCPQLVIDFYEQRLTWHTD